VSVLSDWFAVGSAVELHLAERRTADRVMAGVTLGNEVFTDLDFADDVALLAEMLEALVLAMTIMQE